MRRIKRYCEQIHGIGESGEEMSGADLTHSTGSGQVSPKEIADATRKTVRFINMRATEENWEAEIINKRGDRRFYIDSLPEDVRIRIMAAQAECRSIRALNMPIDVSFA